MSYLCCIFCGRTGNRLEDWRCILKTTLWYEVHKIFGKIRILGCFNFFGYVLRDGLTFLVVFIRFGSFWLIWVDLSNLSQFWDNLSHLRLIWVYLKGSRTKHRWTKYRRKNCRLDQKIEFFRFCPIRALKHFHRLYFVRLCFVHLYFVLEPANHEITKEPKVIPLSWGRSELCFCLLTSVMKLIL